MDDQNTYCLSSWRLYQLDEISEGLTSSGRDIRPGQRSATGKHTAFWYNRELWWPAHGGCEWHCEDCR